MKVSADYEEIPRAGWEEAWRALAGAWQDPRIPARQWEASRLERDAIDRGDYSLPVYSSFLALIDEAGAGSGVGVCEIGAANGWYGELLRRSWPGIRYEAVDYSEAFRDHARRLWPGLAYTVADACQLPFGDRSKEIVVSGGVLLHVADWKKAVWEAARVADRAVLFTRTPVSKTRPTALFRKTAYDVPCLEWRFNEGELANVLVGALEFRSSCRIFGDDDYAHVSYLFRKAPRA